MVWWPRLKLWHFSLLFYFILPVDNEQRARYNLRNIHNIPIPPARLESFKKSFIPSTISLWNELAVEIRQKQTLEEFKSDIKSTKEEPNILYYYGKRWPSVHHARIRIGCSKLNQHLCENLHVIENSSCSCGAIFENTYHYFFECPNFIELRLQLFNAISAFTQVNMNIILNGDNHLSLSQNKLLFEAVHSYIEKTRRFY